MYHLAYTPDLDEAHARGDLRTNTFVAISKTIESDHKRHLQVVNLGDAEALLDNKDHFRDTAQRLIRQGLVDLEDEHWNRWLGRYQDKLRDALSNGFASQERSRSLNQTHER